MKGKGSEYSPNTLYTLNHNLNFVDSDSIHVGDLQRSYPILVKCRNEYAAMTPCVVTLQYCLFICVSSLWFIMDSCSYVLTATS